MPSFSGRYQYLDEKNSPVQGGGCRISFDREILTLVPEKGATLAVDLGDIDIFSPGEYELRLQLYTRKSLLLTHFAKDFQNLSQQLLNAVRDRTVQCLLLEDLEELCRMDGFAQLDSSERTFSSHAEIRIYKSNLAVLPLAATGLQWRFADIDAAHFDEATYTMGLRSGDERLILTRMAKRTTEFRERFQGAMNELSEKSAHVLHSLFPFLTPDQFQQAAETMIEGRAAPVAALRAIHRGADQALAQNAVDKDLKPYYQYLMKNVADEGLYAGFKLIREELEENGAAETAEITHDSADEVPSAFAQDPSDSDGTSAEETGGGLSEEKEAQEVLHFFFFVLRPPAKGNRPSNIVAWEASTRGGRATYFFRLLPPAQTALLDDPAEAQKAVDSSIRQLNRALGILNFRREPIYLPAGSLETQPRYRRYAIACRKLPVLQRLRDSFIGRAVHTNPQAWQRQVEAIRTSL